MVRLNVSDAFLVYMDWTGISWCDTLDVDAGLASLAPHKLNADGDTADKWMYSRRERGSPRYRKQTAE